MVCKSRRAVAALATTVLMVGGCSGSTHPAPAADPDAVAAAFAETLRQQVTVDAMMAHMTKLQEIADAHGGNRALGSPGYDASVDYVAGVLRDHGYDVQTPEFVVRLPFAEEPEVTVAGQPVTAHPLEFTAGTGPQGVSGPMVAAPADDSPGCTDSDYDGLAVEGAVVLVDRGQCPFAQKVAVATARGAVGMVVANNVDGDQMGATLGAQNTATMPVVSVTKADGARLRAQPGNTTIHLDAGVRTEHTRNVIAQTKTGSTSDVVMVGAHLDSVPAGPGINDNGSGVAALLETAVALSGSPDIRNAVRFGFWGAEEIGLRGSADYVGTLDRDQLLDIALYLNFDMLGSPNPGYFTYDGDQSSAPDPRQGVPRVPEGSAGIERTLVAYLDKAGKPAQDTSFDGRSDYDGFTQAGIPAGGLYSGAEETKTVEQARIWGGTADAPFDPNYHQATDTIDHIDRTAMAINGGGVPFAVGLYAQNQRGRNGVPVREDRTRHPLADS